MTFLASWRLAFLALPALLLVAYAVAQHSRRKAVVRFTTVDMLASVAPRRPGWQRHISATFLLAALVALVLGFAQPARAERVPRQRATVILTLDVSGSMIADDVSPTRLAAAQQAARGFVSALPAGVQLGVVSFSTTAQVVATPTADRTAVLSAINGLQAGGGTATADAIDLALSAIHSLPPTASGKPAPAAIVLMSDGSPTIGQNGVPAAQAVADASARAKQAGVPIDTIAYGTPGGVVTVDGQTIPVPSDPAAMAQIASDTGGRTFTAQTAGQLKAVYDQIGRAVGYDVHRHEVTAWFTGFGLILGALAAVAALVWTQRIV